MTNFDPIDEALNIEVSKTPKISHVKKEDTSDNDVTKDYDYTRANLYSLIEKGQETLNGIMELAGDSASPRAFEVAGQVLKSTADIADKLMDLQKKVKEIDETKNNTTNNVTNNAIFTGSTAELQKLIKKGFLDTK